MSPDFMSDHRHYFDHNATTPISRSAREAWMEAVQHHWQNPSSLYPGAGYAKQRLEDAREELADLLDLEEPERVVFLSGATEANNAVLRHLAESRSGKLLTSVIEHPSVEAAGEREFGSDRVEEIPIDPSTGAVVVDWIEKRLLKEEVAAVSVMAANNETGVLQPWREISALCREAGVPYHCDAAQWIGKLPSEGLGECDYVTGCGHKFGGPKGIGFLVVPEEEVDRFHAAVGGPQEGGLRAGTEDLPSVLAMMAAWEERVSALPGSDAGEGRDAFEKRIEERIGARVLGRGGERLWNTSMIALPAGKNVKWLVRLAAAGFAVSTGSACSAGKGNPSRVMQAMGLDYDEMGRVLRFSSGPETSSEDWMALAEALVNVSAEFAGSITNS